jgi:hypothetical protein
MLLRPTAAGGEDAEPGGLGAQLLDADAAWCVHPLFVRQEFVVEPDEAVRAESTRTLPAGPAMCSVARRHMR